MRKMDRDKLCTRKLETLDDCLSKRLLSIERNRSLFEALNKELRMKLLERCRRPVEPSTTCNNKESLDLCSFSVLHEGVSVADGQGGSLPAWLKEGDVTPPSSWRYSRAQERVAVAKRSYMRHINLSSIEYTRPWGSSLHQLPKKCTDGDGGIRTRDTWN